MLKSKKIKLIKKDPLAKMLGVWLRVIFLSIFLSACASTELKAPPVCNNFGQNCEPKVPINQWTP